MASRYDFGIEQRDGRSVLIQLGDARGVARIEIDGVDVTHYVTHVLIEAGVNMTTTVRLELIAAIAFSADAARVLVATPPPAKLQHMKVGDSTACGAPQERGNSFYEWAYVDCPVCLATMPVEKKE